MNTSNEIPTAFPWNHGNVTCTGMTLRDYFAAKAMQGLCADGRQDARQISESAYIVADAMLKVRGQE